MVEVTTSRSREHVLLAAVHQSFNLAKSSNGIVPWETSFGAPVRAIQSKAFETDLLIQEIAVWLDISGLTLAPAIRNPAIRALAVLKNLSEDLRRCGVGLPRPLAAPGEDSGFMLSWDAGEHHLEVEFGEEPIASWFYWKRGTQTTWEKDIQDPPGYDQGALAYLELMRSELH